jgi:cytochrome c-type biogenesis protein CcmH
MAPDPAAPRRPSPATLLLILAALCAAASIGYAALGSGGPSRADAPQAKDWRMVGWAYAEKGDGAASADAYRKAARIEPGNAENWSSLAEALQTGSASVVPEAAAALRKAIAIDPSDPRARYFLAVQKDLSGDHKGAVTDWLALLKDTPAGAPWEADLRRTIEQTAKHYAIAVKWPAPQPAGASPPTATATATAAIPGPTPDQLASAASIPPAQQDKMVRGMVDRLARRLEANPRDADGWIRLMRSRSVLDDRDGAARALRAGLAAFAGDAAVQQKLRAAAAQLAVAAQ